MLPEQARFDTSFARLSQNCCNSHALRPRKAPDLGGAGALNPSVRHNLAKKA